MKFQAWQVSTHEGPDLLCLAWRQIRKIAKITMLRGGACQWFPLPIRSQISPRNLFTGEVSRKNILILIYRIYVFSTFYIWSKISDHRMGNWTRKNHHFLLHGKFLLYSTQQKRVGNNRKKTNRLSASFCTKNHQNPFTSLRERVDWRCCASSKKVPKLKTVMYERIMHAWGA